MSSDNRRRPTQSRWDNSPPRKRTRQHEPEGDVSRGPSPDRRGSPPRGYAANRGRHDSYTPTTSGSNSRKPATPNTLSPHATRSVSMAPRVPGILSKSVSNNPDSQTKAPNQTRKPPDAATIMSKLDEMRQLKRKKQSLMRNSNEQSNGHAVDTPTQLEHAQLKSQQNDIQESKQERAILESRIRRLESHQNEIQVLKTEREQLARRVQDLEAERTEFWKLKEDHARLVSQVERLLSSDIPRLDEGSNKLTGRVRSLETQSSQYEKLKAKVDNLESPVKKVSEDLDGLKAGLANINRDESARQLGSNVDQLEGKLERLHIALQDVQQSVCEHGSDIKNLLSSVGGVVLEILGPYEKGVNERLDKFKEVPSPEELQKLVEQVVSQKLAKFDSLHTSMMNDLEKLRGDVDSTSLCVDTKANTMEVKEEINNIRHSFKVLDHQYNNLHTQELHNRIIQTLLRQVPQNPAGLVQEINKLNQDVQQMQRTIRDIPWLVAQQSDVLSLLASAPQLLALTQTNSDPQRVTEHNSREKQVSAAADAAAESSRLEGLISLEKDIRLRERREIESNFSQEMGQLTQLLNGKTEGVPQIHEKVKALEQIVDGINSKYIIPNRHYFDFLSRLILAVAQLQLGVLDLRQHVQKLNGNRHECRWTEDLSKYSLGPLLAALQDKEDGGKNRNGDMAE